MPQRIERQRTHGGIREVQRVAGAGIVDERAVGGAGISGIVQPAQRQRWPGQVALPAVVEHQIEDRADPRRPERRHRIAQLAHPAGREARVERHRHDRIISPAVAQPERRQVTLVDPRDDRHQFHRRDVQTPKVRDHRRVSQRRDRAALRGGDVRVAHREGADIDLVHQPAGAEQRRQVERRQRRGDDRAGHQRGGVDARLGQSRIAGEEAIERDCVRIDQQLGNVERRLPVSAKAVARAGGQPGDMRAPHVAVARHRDAAFNGAVEQAQPQRGRTGRADRHIDAPRRRGGGHVTTSGWSRPVWRRMPAIASAAATISASIAPVSASRSPSAGA